MEYRRLGKSGLKVSALSLGSWLTFGQQIEDATAEKLMDIAYEGGINFFDNAEAYANGKSEEVMGKILKKKNWDRSTWVVSSKVFWGGNLPNQKGLGRKHVTEACHAALKRLQVDYLDLFFCHRPDLETPIEETVWVMNDLIRQGKILYWGTSEWSAQEIMAAHAVARENHLIPPTMEQPQYNMFTRERMEKEHYRIFRETGMGTTIWSPLASGLLTGKYNKGEAPEGTRAHLKGLEWLKEKLTGEEAKNTIPKIQQLMKLADELDTKLPVLAVAWCAKNTDVSTVILGASKPYQLEENLQAIDLLPKLTDEVMQHIEKILDNRPQIDKW